MADSDILSEMITSVLNEVGFIKIYLAAADNRYYAEVHKLDGSFNFDTRAETLEELFHEIQTDRGPKPWLVRERKGD